MKANRNNGLSQRILGYLFRPEESFLKYIPRQVKCRNLVNLACVLLVCYVLVITNNNNGTDHPSSRERHNQHLPIEHPESNAQQLHPHEETKGAALPIAQPPTSSEKTSASGSLDNKENKIILFWTPYYDRADFTIGFGQNPFIQAGCKVTNCETTADRSMLNRSSAVIFHSLQFKKKDRPDPSTRLPSQRYIFYLYETIPNTSVPCIGKCLPSHEYTPHYFNWTMTHRRDSDIYVAEPYGAIEPKYWTLPTQMPDDLPEGQMPPDPAQLLNPRKDPKLAKRTKMIAWFSSHCPTHSQREDYVKELAKHIQVDIYGKCGNMECLPRNSPQCNSVLDGYKFYLAAENSLCPDYVTEKFYRALTTGVVPIVYGGADYSQYAPPNSYINVADFASPKDLADYLHLLDKNDALYLKYFEWTKLYRVVRRPLKGWCDLCAKLNRPELPAKSYQDVTEWWVRQLPCYPGSSFLQNHL